MEFFLKVLLKEASSKVASVIFQALYSKGKWILEVLSDPTVKPLV